MNRRHLLGITAALVTGSFAGCTTNLISDGGTNDQNHTGLSPDIDDEHLRDLVTEINGFALDLYYQLLETHPSDNLFSSPVSITIALAMAYAGARGETRRQMQDVLRYPLDDDTLHDAFSHLQQTLNERGEAVDLDDLDAYAESDDPVPFELTLVNAVWGQEGYPFKETYLSVLEDQYGGELREVDYQTNADGARDQINDWVAQETQDRIDELLPDGALNQLTRIVLVNAVYFLANWATPFPESNTSPEIFTALDGTDHEVSMMRHDDTWRYGTVAGTHAVELPYVGNDVSMLVILPPAGEFESFERSLDGDTLRELIDALEAREGEVRLPRFEFDAGFELGEILETMGMTDAFHEQHADFSGIADLAEAGENLLIDDVYHDAFVAVDETGTEAAAATGVVIRAESAPADPFKFIADRPFLFVIRDVPTDTMLFLGRAVDPAGWE